MGSSDTKGDTTVNNIHVPSEPPEVLRVREAERLMEQHDAGTLGSVRARGLLTALGFRSATAEEMLRSSGSATKGALMEARAYAANTMGLPVEEVMDMAGQQLIAKVQAHRLKLDPAAFEERLGASRQRPSGLGADPSFATFATTTDLLAHELVALLNSALGADQRAVASLFAVAIPCTLELTAHPHIPVSLAETGHALSVLGVLNGLLNRLALPGPRVRAVDHVAGDPSTLLRFELAEPSAHPAEPGADSHTFDATCAETGCTEPRGMAARFNPLWRCLRHRAPEVPPSAPPPQEHRAVSQQKPSKGQVVFVKHHPSEASGNASPMGWDEENVGTILRVDEEAGFLVVGVTFTYKSGSSFQACTSAEVVPIAENVLGQSGYSWRWPPRA